MYALDLIMQNANVEKLLTHYKFNISHSDGNVIRSSCAIHGGNNPTAFVMNKETTLWYCHTGGCGGGDLITLVEKMEDIKFIEAVEWLANFYDVDISNIEISKRKSSLQKELEQFIKTVKGKKKKDITEYQLPMEAKLVQKFRNFKLETLQHFGLAYVDEIELEKNTGDKYVLYRRLVFPIRFNYKVVGMSLRRTITSDFPKWSQQPSGIETERILYNYDTAKEANTIVIVEGITDVWAFHEISIHAVATFGAHITDEQYKLLLKTGADLVTGFDGDKAGRIATDKAKVMFKNKANLSIINFTDGQDPENISREELKELYDNR